MTDYSYVPQFIDRPAQSAIEVMSAGGSPPTADEWEGLAEGTDVFFRVKTIRVLDAPDLGGRSEVKVIGVSADDISDEPFTLNLQTWTDIADGQTLALDPAGLVLYANPPGKLPRFFDFRLLVLEDDSDVRDTGQMLSKLSASSEYGTARDALIALLGIAAPQAAAVTAGVNLLISAVATVLQGNKDDQMIYVAGTLTNSVDQLGVPRGPVTMATRRVEVTYETVAGKP